VLEKWRNLNLNGKSLAHEHYFSARPRSKPRLGMIYTCLCGKHFEFLTGSSVFSRDHVDLGTRLLIESMILPERGYSLDLGCGYGAVGVAVAAFKPCLQVIMVDINQRAVWLARQNVERNNLNNAEIRKGRLYEPVEGICFNTVLSNPPVSAGMETVRKLIIEAPKHMANKGTLQVVVRSKICGKRLRSYFEDAFGNVDVLARESGYRVLLSKKS